MAAFIRAYDWAPTPLGSLERWPNALRTAVDIMLAMPGPATIMWGPQHVQLYNDAYITIARDRHPLLLGHPVAEGWPDVYSTVIAPLLENARAGRATRLKAFPVPLRGPAGLEERVFDTDWVPIRDESGAVAGTLQTLVEATDRLKAQAGVRAGEARHGLLIKSWAQAVWETDPHGVVIADSPSWRAYTGQTLQEWLGYGWLDAIHPDDRAFAERQWREATAAHGLVNAEFRLQAPNGEWRWTNVRAAPMLDAKGNIEKWVGMNIDIDARKRAEIIPNALADGARRLEAVLNNASVSIFFMDHRQQCVYMNRAAEQLTGFTLEEVLALDKPLHDIIHHIYPDGRPFPLHECAIDRAFPEHNKVQGEDVFVRRDGSFYPVSFTASPIQDEASKTIGTIIEVIDITEQKRAGEKQRMLIDELDHRVKNTLATVQAVASQTFKKSDPNALDQFVGRLTVLAKAHNILMHTSWHKAGVSEIATEVLAPFGLDRFTLGGPSCEVHPKAAVSLAMVLHELATNAVKHGSLSVPSGAATLHWVCKHSSDHTELDMSWEESGGPPVTQPTHRGFGLRLIERQLGFEFGGKAEFEFQENGLVCRMHLNMPRNSGPVDLQTHLWGGT